MSDKVVMSDEQFEKLLKAIAEVGRTYPHVCPPCLRPHVPNWYWKYQLPYQYSNWIVIGTTDTSKVIF